MAAPLPGLDPHVIVSRDGKTAVEVVRYDGQNGISDRDATGFYFTLRLSPDGEESRMGIMFSGTVLMTLGPATLKTPDFGNSELFFVHVAEARIGTFLDQNGPPEPIRSGALAVQVPCFSDEVEEWANRSPAEDEEIEDYVRARLYWSWRYGYEKVIFTTPDFLRLGVDLKQFMRIVNLGIESEWTVHRLDTKYVTLKPLASFLHAERQRRKGIGTGQGGTTPAPSSGFVSDSRIEELRRIENAPYDLRRLIALCEELNICATNNCFHAVAMLTRAIVDHVPPIFQAKGFSEVASSYPGARSFKESMTHLSMSARKIADAHLHVQIRSKEVLPTRTQVDFSRDLDVLLAEIVRILQ